jgi:hypothetical protein
MDDEGVAYLAGDPKLKYLKIEMKKEEKNRIVHLIFFLIFDGLCQKSIAFYRIHCTWIRNGWNVIPRRYSKPKSEVSD